MTNRDFQALLNRTMKAHIVHKDLIERCGEVFIERYGVHYSDVDADFAIDTLDYGGGTITVEECDKMMAELGYPRLNGAG